MRKTSTLSSTSGVRTRAAPAVPNGLLSPSVLLNNENVDPKLRNIAAKDTKAVTIFTPPDKVKAAKNKSKLIPPQSRRPTFRSPNTPNSAPTSTTNNVAAHRKLQPQNVIPSPPPAPRAAAQSKLNRSNAATSASPPSASITAVSQLTHKIASLESLLSQQTRLRQSAETEVNRLHKALSKAETHEQQQRATIDNDDSVAGLIVFHCGSAADEYDAVNSGASSCSDTDYHDDDDDDDDESFAFSSEANSHDVDDDDDDNDDESSESRHSLTINTPSRVSINHLRTPNGVESAANGDEQLDADERVCDTDNEGDDESEDSASTVSEVMQRRLQRSVQQLNIQSNSPFTYANHHAPMHPIHYSSPLFSPPRNNQVLTNTPAQPPTTPRPLLTSTPILFHHDIPRSTSVALNESYSTDDTEVEEENNNNNNIIPPSENGEGYTDIFPYEKNLYLLSRLYHFITRLYSCRDAVTFKAIHIRTKQHVCIKISEGFHLNKNNYNNKKSHPKEIRILSSVQGHPRIMKLLIWYGLPQTYCYAFVCEYIENISVENILYNNIKLIRQYIYDLLCALRHMHTRLVLYRDVKPSNVLYNHQTQRATLIDFDVSTYYDTKRLHRSYVGTDGYTAPEMIAIMAATRDGRRLPYSGYTTAVDVYSCGVVLGQLLFGVRECAIADPTDPSSKAAAFVVRSRILRPQILTNNGRYPYELMEAMLIEDPQRRITVHQALQHPWFIGVKE